MNLIHQNILSNINPNYKILSRFPGGMSNYTYLIEDLASKEKFTFRYPGEGAYNFVDYYEEENNLSLIHPLNINSPIVYLDPQTGIKIAKYIPGYDLKEQPTDLDQIAALLKKLHNSSLSLTSEYQHLQRLAKYETLCVQPKKSEYLDLKEKFITIFTEQLAKHVTTPCHCDAQLANFILSTDDTLYLLDWEFAATNDYLYDIASFGNVDFNDALALLAKYSPNITDDMLVRLYGWRMFQCLQWHNVATYKAEIGLGSKINIAFDKVADNYLVLAHAMYQKLIEYN